MKDLNKIAIELFNKIRTRFPSVSLGNEDAGDTVDPKEGRFFNFDFVIDQNNFGNITIILNDKNLKVFFSRKITRDLDTDQRKVWYDFLKNIRGFAKQNLLRFDARDISRDHLTISDLKTSIAADSVTESIQRAPSQIIVKRIKKEGRDYNKITAIFVENSRHERFLLPVNSLTYARAMVPHLEAGGNIYDGFGKHVQNLVQEKIDLERFSRYGRRASYLPESGQNLVQEARDRVKSIKHQLAQLARDDYYQTYYNDHFQHEEEPLDENMVRLRELFVRPVVDPRVEAALPHLRRLTIAEEFENWVNSVEEDIHDVPSNEKEIGLLRDLFAEELPLGVDGINAIAAVQEILSSDELEKDLENAAGNDPDSDARPVIRQWIDRNLPNLLQDIDTEENSRYTSPS
jgi:hypothetical protein